MRISLQTKEVRLNPIGSMLPHLDWTPLNLFFCTYTHSSACVVGQTFTCPLNMPKKYYHSLTVLVSGFSVAFGSLPLFNLVATYIKENFTAARHWKDQSHVIVRLVQAHEGLAWDWLEPWTQVFYCTPSSDNLSNQEKS